MSKKSVDIESDEKSIGNKGDVISFDQSWKTQKESSYNHWTRATPENQIQLAFQMHWELFKEYLNPLYGKKCVEVGCGRGTISSYFAQNGYDCTLLDYSLSAVHIAREIFNNNGHDANFVCGDANHLPFANDSFDVVVSIGLLEHFEDIQTPVAEQIRILMPGGLFLGYIVPERPDNIQKYFNWVNSFLKFIYKTYKHPDKKSIAKKDIFRNTLGSKHYMSVLDDLPVTDVTVLGMYPLPMVSHSPEFPFTLLPAPLELVLTTIFRLFLGFRRIVLRRNPWACHEKIGQAFLVLCYKEGVK